VVDVQVLVQLAKLADAELMPAVVELAADALKAACLQDAVAVVKATPEEVSCCVLSKHIIRSAHHVHMLCSLQQMP
jgi:hypothetical protein